MQTYPKMHFHEFAITAKQELEKINQKAIPMEPYWNTDSEPESGIHSVHSYPARFPAFIPTKAIAYAKTHGCEVSIISDIFCGCGTVALEAKNCGVDFWGCDINPVATLIASVKSGSYSRVTLEKYYKQILEYYGQERQHYDSAYDTAKERLKYWFRENQYNDLFALLSGIRTVHNPKYRKVFECLFSSILKGCSIWLTKSIKPQKDLDKDPADVISSFHNQFEHFSKVMMTGNSSTKIVIKTENFLTAEHCPNVDVIVTSPPYVTSYEYADLHQLSSLWLGYTNDYKELRKGTIGSMTPDAGDYLEPLNLNHTGAKVVQEMQENREIQKHKVDAVSRYFLDMQRAAKKCYQMMNQNSFAFFVVGDTEYKGVKILNSKHLTEALLDAGFSEVRLSRREIKRKNLTPYRNEKGQFSRDKNSRQVYHEEYVIIGRKNGTD